MILLLKYIIKGITGSSDFSIDEKETDGRTTYDIKASPDIIGLIIGKGGQTIRHIRNIMRIKAVLDKKSIYITVSEN
jgi:predicted RNA-binding protein YlqC (UPF0109 family)